jgi:N-acetylmuramidase
MNTADLQRWLNAHGQQVTVDGAGGPQTRMAIVHAFTNPEAPGVNDADLSVVASRLGCTTKQIKAVAKVESGGGAFDRDGRPKILFERHKFYQITSGKHGITSFSNPNGGGYGEDSWLKLTKAACVDVDAAFASASWGKFQVLGTHWKALGFASPLELAYSTVGGEAAHYELLARFIEHNGLKQKLAALSANPADNAPFAARYNGPAFRKFDYDVKLAEAMR